MSEDTGITLGEVGRRVDRVESEMRAGFAGIREEIQRLAFVPAGVYAADRASEAQRMQRIEEDLAEEKREREDSQKTTEQRSWQARLSLIMALIGLPLSIIGSVIVALLVARLT